MDENVSDSPVSDDGLHNQTNVPKNRNKSDRRSNLNDDRNTPRDLENNDEQKVLTKRNGTDQSDGVPDGRVDDPGCIHAPNVSADLNSTPQKAVSECRYGWFDFRPEVLQFLTNDKIILFWFCMASAIQGMVVNGFVNVVISNIERRFDLTSTETGTVASCYDIASVICLIPVSYFGGLGRKPRYVFFGVAIMGLGSLLFSLPHFLTGVYNISPMSGEMCLANNTLVSGCASGSPRTLSVYRYFFFFGQLLHGAGAAPLYTLGVTYMDENLSKKQSPVYISIFFAMSIVGPALGYLLGGAFIGIHTDYYIVDVQTLGLEPSNPKWVGAWWIGFLISMTLAFITALPLSGFPVALKGNENLEEKCDEVYIYQTFTPDKKELASNEASVGHILRSIRVLLFNPTFMFLNVAAACEGLILSGFSTFTPKFLETQFLIDSGSAATYVGFAAIPAGGGGTLIGGYIVRKFDLHVRGLLRFCLCCSSISIFFLLVFLVQCDMMPFAGVNVDYPRATPNISITPVRDYKRNLYNLSDSCNSKCSCDESLYNPVCGDNQFMYYSSCFAGCRQSVTRGDNREYTDCACILSKNQSSPYGEAKPGACKSTCKNLPVFMSVFAIIMLLIFLTSMPALQATLRCMPFHQRSLGLGIQWIIARCFGSIPGPILFGRVIDLTCTLWQEQCGEGGSCHYYDNITMGRNLMAISIAVKCVSTLCFFISLSLYRSPPAQADSDKGTELLSVAAKNDDKRST